MNDILTGILIGLGSGIILVPIMLWGLNTFKNTIERRNIKRMIQEGKMLKPIDKKDYDHETWDKFFDASKNDERVKNLNKDIFGTDEPRKGKGITNQEEKK